MPFNRIRMCVFVALALGLASLGCSRVNGMRQRYFARPETTVPTVELDRGRLESNRDAATARNRPRTGGQFGPGTADRLAWRPVGESVEGRPIETLQLGNGARRVLLIGGIHGDEPEGLPVTEQFARELASDRTATRGATVLVVRNLNPDGTAARSRTNTNGVDLNRNFPASNWDSTASQPRFNPGPHPGSEPETRLLIELIREFQPNRILVMHATRGKPMVNYDGPARELAERLSQFNGYVTSDTIGYPTPGSLGSYAGIDMQIPIITLELPRGIGTEQAWQANRDALFQLIR